MGEGPAAAHEIARLDHAVAARGLARSRAQAREAILAGQVTVDGRTVTRPGGRVAATARIERTGTEPASRGAVKLAAALDHFGIDARGAHALDVGASTGGFTEVLLQRGAAHVVALDVGRGQLLAHLAADRRVTVLDGVNARDLTLGALPYAPDLVVVDVSFISLTLVLPAVLPLATPAARLVALVKPQFEVGRAAVGKGGIVRDAAAVHDATLRVADLLRASGWQVAPELRSPITGADGNREVLLSACR